MSRLSLRTAALALRTPAALTSVAILAAACADSVTGTRAPVATASAFLSPTGGTGGPGRYVVGLEEGVELSSETLAAAGARVIDRNDAIHAVEVDAVDPAALQAAGVRYVGRSFEFTLDAEQGGGVAPAAAAAPPPRPTPSPRPAPTARSRRGTPAACSGT